jgi:hypothetical protein
MNRHVQQLSCAPAPPSSARRASIRPISMWLFWVIAVTASASACTDLATGAPSDGTDAMAVTALDGGNDADLTRGDQDADDGVLDAQVDSDGSHPEDNVNPTTDAGDSGPVAIDSGDTEDADDDAAQPTNLCASQTVCTDAHLCIDTPEGFTCLGRFAEWPMPDARSDSKIKPDYTKPIPGIVEDTVTGLQWQGTLLFEDLTWGEAKRACESLSLAGSGWRMPSWIELYSLINHDATPVLQDQLFVGEGAALDGYGFYLWTSSPWPGSTTDVRALNMDEGSFATVPKTGENLSVRCVRSRSPHGNVIARLDLSSPDLIIDRMTGLQWRRSIDQVPYTPGESDDVCPLLGAGWRLPTLKELLTLVDPERTDPATLDEIAELTPTGGYWSSVPNTTGSVTGQWYVDFGTGDPTKALAVGSRPPTNFVRCVQ